MATAKKDDFIQLSQEHIKAAKEKHGDEGVVCYLLQAAADNDGNTGEVFGHALFLSEIPPQVLKTFYRNFGTDRLRAMRNLISGTLLDCPLKEKILAQNSDNKALFAAAFDAASNHLPVGSAKLVKI